VSARGPGRRMLLERIVALGKPSWLASHAPPPREIAPGLWSVDRLLGIPAGPRLPGRALLVELPEGGMLAWSPVPLADALREFVEARGGARFLVAPNSFHYLGLAEWKRAFPEAEIWLAPGLPARIADVPGGCELREGAATPFAATLPHRVLDCARGITEVAFFHVRSHTLLLCDSSFNLSPPPRAIDRLGARLLGIPFRFGPPLTARLLLLRDRTAVAAWIEELCAWDFVRVVMAHGEPLDAGPRELHAAFANWLD
jgi:Domain of unknown function (DUF4336)